MTSFPVPPLLVPALAIGFAAYRGYLRMQGREDRESAIETWAALNGYEMVDQPAGSTPTLEADNASAGPCFAVPVGEQDAVLFAFNYTVGSGKDEVTVDTTVVQAELAAGFPHFRVLPRHGRNLPPGPGGEQQVELESVEFQRDHRLLAGRDVDRDALIRLFDPETIVWWIDLGSLAPIVEYQTGTLVVRSTVALTDGAEFDMLVGQAQKIAGRVLAEGLLHRA